MSVSMFRCNLPPALFAEWPGCFMCHCCNMGVEQTLNKCHHTKLTLEKKMPLLLLLGFKLTTFQSWVRHSYQLAIPARCLIRCIQNAFTDYTWFTFLLGGNEIFCGGWGGGLGVNDDQPVIVFSVFSQVLAFQRVGLEPAGGKLNGFMSFILCRTWTNWPQDRWFHLIVCLLLE